MLKHMLILVMFCTGSALGTPILVLTPSSGMISGVPGQTVGWGFSLTNTSLVDTLTVTTSYLINETDPAMGTYSDIISYFGGPSNFEMAPSTTWSELFSYNPDPSLQTGVGYYVIDPGAPGGSSDQATLVVEYELDNATTGNFDSSGSLFVPVEAQATPEPGTLGLLLAAAAVWLCAGVRLAGYCNEPRYSPATEPDSDRSTSQGLSLVLVGRSERPGAVKGALLLRGEANP